MLSSRRKRATSNCSSTRQQYAGTSYLSSNSSLPSFGRQRYNIKPSRGRQQHGRSYLLSFHETKKKKNRKSSSCRSHAIIIFKLYIILVIIHFCLFRDPHDFQQTTTAETTEEPSKMAWILRWWYLFLDGPSPDSLSTRKRVKGYQVDSATNQREPDDPSWSRPRAQHRLTRSSEQRRQVHEMKRNFEQLEKDSKLKSCQWQKVHQAIASSQHAEQPGVVPLCSLPRQQTSRGVLGNSMEDRFQGVFNFGSLHVEKRFVLRNTLPHDRILSCRETGDQIILANGGTLEVNERQMKQCQANFRTRLFQETLLSTSDNRISKGQDNLVQHPKHFPPIVLAFNDADPADAEPFTSGNEDKKNTCSIPCHVAGTFELLSYVGIEGTNWEIIKSMEGPAYYSQTEINPEAYKSDQYYATTSFLSDIPSPYYSQSEYNIQAQRVDFDTAIKGASYLANNCDSRSGRDEYVQALIDATPSRSVATWLLGGQARQPFRVDSLSSCLHNAELPRGIQDATNKTAILERYLFHLAFENQRQDDYITEKLWGALAAGTVPVYFGAPNVKDHVPAKSVIFADDFESPKELAKYLSMLSINKQLYNEYHTWRTKPFDELFATKYQFTSIHSTCRICKWAFAKRYGLGWNHEQQEVTLPHIPRQTCRNKLGLIGHPFKEYWMASSTDGVSSVWGGENHDGNGVHSRNQRELLTVASGTAMKTCKLDDTNRVVYFGADQRLQRTVYNQDGVTDLVITYDPTEGGGDNESLSTSWTLELETPLGRGELRSVDGRRSILQDQNSRVTVVTSRELILSSHRPGSIEIPVSLLGKSTLAISNPLVLLQIRIIVEDLDKFHRGGINHVNYFGKLMTQDFLYPLEAYEIVTN